MSDAAPDQQPPERLGAYEVLEPIPTPDRWEHYLGVTGAEFVTLTLLRPAPSKVAIAAKEIARVVRLASLVSGENVVRAFRAERENDVAFLVSQHVTGCWLSDLLASGGVEPAMAMRILLDVATGLQSIHNSSAVHGDLRPATVQLGEDGKVRLGMLGVSALTTYLAVGENVRTARIPYRPPEEVRGRMPSLPGNLYSFGVLVYELLVGATPFPSGSIVGTVVQQYTPEPAQKKVPEALGRFLVRLLSPTASARPTSARVVLEVLEEIAQTLKPATAEQVAALVRVTRADLQGGRAPVPGRPAPPVPASAAAQLSPVATPVRIEKTPPPSIPTDALRAAMSAAQPPRRSVSLAKPPPPPPGRVRTPPIPFAARRPATISSPAPPAAPVPAPAAPEEEEVPTTVHASALSARPSAPVDAMPVPRPAPVGTASPVVVTPTVTVGVPASPALEMFGEIAPPVMTDEMRSAPTPIPESRAASLERTPTWSGAPPTARILSAPPAAAPSAAPAAQALAPVASPPAPAPAAVPPAATALSASAAEPAARLSEPDPERRPRPRSRRGKVPAWLLILGTLLIGASIGTWIGLRERAESERRARARAARSTSAEEHAAGSDTGHPEEPAAPPEPVPTTPSTAEAARAEPSSAPAPVPAPPVAPAPPAPPAPVVEHAAPAPPRPAPPAPASRPSGPAHAQTAGHEDATRHAAPRPAPARPPRPAPSPSPPRPAPAAGRTGTLVVSCPARCDVRIDGASSPQATGGGARVSPGSHAVVVTDTASHTSRTLRVYVPEGGTVQRRVSF